MCGLLPLSKKPSKQLELRPVSSYVSISWEIYENVQIS